MIRTLASLALCGLVTLIAVSLLSAMAAANTVPGTGLGFSTRGITANDLKPPECAGINVTNLVTGSGTITGTAGSDLILGSANADTINGGDGDDCIVAGGGNDTVSGGKGNDVILAGPGDDANIRGDQGTDDCYGGPGVDTFHVSCETQSQ